jgi:hypothetical protein
MGDRRSYPRQQAVTFFQLLYAWDVGDGFESAGGEKALKISRFGGEHERMSVPHGNAKCKPIVALV